MKTLVRRGSYPSAEMQSVYSASLADLAKESLILKRKLIIHNIVVSVDYLQKKIKD